MRRSYSERLYTEKCAICSHHFVKGKKGDGHHPRRLNRCDTGRGPARRRRQAVRATHRAAPREPESRAEKKGRTRQALLDTTMDLVADRSFSGLSLREVARGAGIVPTAFYRHFTSMEDLGVTLVEDSMRVLRRTLREGRRDLAARNALPTATNSLEILLDHVRTNEAQFRFLVREQHGGVPGSAAIDTELRLFSKELAIDLARIPDMAAWLPDDRDRRRPDRHDHADRRRRSPRR